MSAYRSIVAAASLYVLAVRPVRREHSRIVGLRRGYKCVTLTSNSAAALVKIALVSVGPLHNPPLSSAIKNGKTVRSRCRTVSLPQRQQPCAGSMRRDDHG